MPRVNITGLDGQLMMAVNITRTQVVVLRLEQDIVTRGAAHNGAWLSHKAFALEITQERRPVRSKIALAIKVDDSGRYGVEKVTRACTVRFVSDKEIFKIIFK